MRNEVAKCDVCLALPHHEVHDDQALEYYRPGGVAQPVLQDAEDLGDASLAGMRGDEDVLDIFGLWCRELWE